jgi:hypothetical protein
MLKAGIQNFSGLFRQQISHLLSLIGNMCNLAALGCPALVKHGLSRVETQARTSSVGFDKA